MANADEEPEYIHSRYYTYPESEIFDATVTVNATDAKPNAITLV